MTADTKTYSVDKSKFNHYLKTTRNSWITKALIILCIILTLQALIVFNLDNNIPFGVLIFATVIIFVALYFGHEILTSRLKKFQNAVYKLTPKTLTINRDDIKPRDIILSDIVVFHKTQKGTTLLTGNGWTKFDYYRPKISGNSLDKDNQIFIPSVTHNYDELIKEIKKRQLNIRLLESNSD